MKRIIGCIIAAFCLIVLIFAGVILMRRPVKPETYQLENLTIPSFTNVTGKRKIIGTHESLRGGSDGFLESASYTYVGGNGVTGAVERYVERLQRSYGAAVEEQTTRHNSDGGTVKLSFATDYENLLVVMDINYSSELCVIELSTQTVEEVRPSQQPNNRNQQPQYAISKEEAYNRLLTLTKAETGFKADIGIYGYEIDDEVIELDGWHYYVITIVADYDDGRIEYRGTFYVCCEDGTILRAGRDLESGRNARIR